MMELAKTGSPINGFSKSLSGRQGPGIIAEIKRVFDNNDKGEIMLSTVHKAKGLEADNVYILATERMPHPKATNPKEERNICYVAITRAKKNLFYCGPKPRS